MFLNGGDSAFGAVNAVHSQSGVILEQRKDGVANAAAKFA
jgi:hypothetical protein